MSDALKTISVEQFRALFPDVKDVNMGRELCLASIPFEEGQTILTHPFRLDAYVAMFCMDGEMEVSINLDTYHVTRNQLVICIPGNIMRVNRQTETGTCMVLAASSDFMSSMKMDFNALFKDILNILSSPCINLEDNETWLFNRYVSLGRELIGWGDPSLDKREALGSLISSFFYALGSSLTRRLDEIRKEDGFIGPASRSKLIFDQFIHLVNNHHAEYRCVDFYARKLNLTPKYLSKVVKQVSGRSAPDWIDSYVILEAKNMLRYSDMPIKQIMFNLNFDNHSVFYKYFKSHTGMTPTEYRNS